MDDPDSQGILSLCVFSYSKQSSFLIDCFPHNNSVILPGYATKEYCVTTIQLSEPDLFFLVF